MENLYNIFMSATNTQFCNCVQNLKDFHWVTVNTPEATFVWVQDYYDNINAKPGAEWLKTKKSKTAFTAGTTALGQPVGTCRDTG